MLVTSADIDWYYFAHNGPSECAKQGRQLFIDERGTSGDLTEVWIRCECGKAERSMAAAAILANRALGFCDGARPWLGPFTKESCGEPSRLLIRSASNAYFPQTMSVISLPDRDDAVRQAIDAVWSYVEAVEGLDDLKYERKKAAVKAGLEGISNDEAFAEIQLRRLGGSKMDKPVKVAELETLVASKDEVGEDRPEGVFYARALPRLVWECPWMEQIERVVLVHRLREVVAAGRVHAIRGGCAGHRRRTRHRSTPCFPCARSELASCVREQGRRHLSPVQNKGNLGVDATARGTSTRSETGDGIHRMAQGTSGHDAEFPGAAYLMLHSFSHLLITALSLGCGYPQAQSASACTQYQMSATAFCFTPELQIPKGLSVDLVQVGRRIQETVKAALDLGMLCSNDPVCAQHDPASRHERRFLHGAACHGCLLISETSCEQQNDFLDRALVVPTVQDVGGPFFSEIVTSEGSTSVVGAV